MFFLRRGILDQMAEINQYLLRRVREQEHELSGQKIIIEELRKELESWKPDRDKKGRFK